MDEKTRNLETTPYNPSVIKTVLQDVNINIIARSDVTAASNGEGNLDWRSRLAAEASENYTHVQHTRNTQAGSNANKTFRGRAPLEGVIVVGFGGAIRSTAAALLNWIGHANNGESKGDDDVFSKHLDFGWALRLKRELECLI
jgi:hypothetical protein